jgi:hypothetical protein
MNNAKKLGILVVVVGLAAGFARAATQPQFGHPDGTLRLSGGSFAAGIGFSWGSGTLTYKGKDYPVKVNGLSVGKVGITGSSAYGEVYNLHHLRDFSGHYNAGAAGSRGVTVGAGKSGTIMTNPAGVTVVLHSRQRGVDVNAAGAGVDMQLTR